MTEEVRDLTKEVAARRAARFSECDRCGKKWKEPITLHRLQTHYEHPACQAEHRTRALRASGYATITSGSLIHKVMQAAGLPVKEERTQYERGRGPAWGNRDAARRAQLKVELWIPKWISKLFEDTWRITRGFSNDEAIPMLAVFVKELNGDLEKRQGAFAALRLGGVDALHGLIFTRAFRAKKLRADAAKRMEEALELERQANELDPPEEVSRE